MLSQWIQDKLFGWEDRQLPGNTGYYDLEKDFATYADGGPTANPYQTAAVEYSFNEQGRAFMACVMTPVMPMIGPLELAMIARQLLALGNAVFEIYADPDGIGLLPIATYTVTGGVRPSSWTYNFKQQRPNGASDLDLDALPTLVRPATGIVHVRYMPRPEAPWRGVSPLIGAGVSAQTLARIESGLSQDANVGAGEIIAVPDGATAQQVTQAKNALTTGRGKVSLVETSAAGWGQGQQAKPSGDYQQRRFGPEPPATAIDLREKSAAALIAALGAPTPSAQGAALREGYRHFMANTIASNARLIEQELSRKLEQPVSIRFPERIRSDISALSRAYKSLSETDRQWAADIVGLPSPPEEVIIPGDAEGLRASANHSTNGKTSDLKGGRNAQFHSVPG